MSPRTWGSPGSAAARRVKRLSSSMLCTGKHDFWRPHWQQEQEGSISKSCDSFQFKHHEKVTSKRVCFCICIKWYMQHMQFKKRHTCTAEQREVRCIEVFSGHRSKCLRTPPNLDGVPMHGSHPSLCIRQSPANPLKLNFVAHI